ncbi:MAG TPA: hypothetical protein VGG85_09580 [Terracidiphilus sp.]
MYTGAFLLAAAGLIDGKRAVTHWHFCDRLAREFPEVNVLPNPIVLRDGSIYTSAGIYGRNRSLARACRRGSWTSDGADHR